MGLSLFCSDRVCSPFQSAIRKLEQRVEQLLKEKASMESEQSRALLTRSRLEGLCRELQKQNKLVKVCKWLNSRARRLGLTEKEGIGLHHPNIWAGLMWSVIWSMTWPVIWLVTWNVAWPWPAPQEESVAKIREEEEKRREVSAKFQTTLSDITGTMNENNQKNTKLTEENIEMSKKLKSLCEQYEQNNSVRGICGCDGTWFSSDIQWLWYG